MRTRITIARFAASENLGRLAVCYLVRNEKEYFDDIPDARITKDMIEFATHIVKSKSGRFKPEKFEDRYENALRELIEAKEKGKPLVHKPHAAPRTLQA